MATTLREAFETFKSRLELSDSFQAAVTTHHNAIRKRLESKRNIRTKLIGSLQRQTKIQPLEGGELDIDILVIFNDFDEWVSDGVSPATALRALGDIVEGDETYRKLEPETDSPTVGFEYKDEIRIELVPSYNFVGDSTSRPKGYYIPGDNKWVLADYDYDAEYISKANTYCDKYLIPTIKMLKAAKRKFFPGMHSYHLETLVTLIIPSIIRNLKSEVVPVSFPLLICGFFEIAQNKIREEARIPGSKSTPADEGASLVDKIGFTSIFKKISEVCKKLLPLSDDEAIPVWRELIGPPFPAEG